MNSADPHFQQIGHAFIEEQRLLYGTDTYGDQHFYSCDTFNENTPPSNEPAYLDAMGRNLYSAMADADPKAVWVLQDWTHFGPASAVQVLDDPGIPEKPGESEH